MAANSKSPEYVEPTYGNWRLPVRAGLGRLSGLTSVMVFISIFVTIFVLKLGGMVQGLVTALVCLAVLAALSIKDKHGYSSLEKLVERVIFMFSRLFKRNKYRSGPLGFTKEGTFKLPGVASSVTPYQGMDSMGTAFTLVHMPAVGTYSVTFAVEPDGASLVGRIRRLLGRMGRAIQGLRRGPCLRGRTGVGRRRLVRETAVPVTVGRVGANSSSHLLLRVDRQKHRVGHSLLVLVGIPRIIRRRALGRNLSRRRRRFRGEKVLVAANSKSPEYVEPTYGNWRLPVRAGLGRLSGLTSVMVFISIFVTIFVLKLGGMVQGLVTALVCLAVLAALSIKDKHGYSSLEKLVERVIFMFSRLFKRNKYRSGPLGFTKEGTFKLPGVASSVTPYQGMDSMGTAFTLVHMPAVGTYSVTFAVEPDGASLVDQQDIDQWVANWGGFLAGLGREVGLIGAVVTSEVSQGSGARLQKEIKATLSPDASPVAQQMLQEAAVTYPAGVTQHQVWVSLVFSAAPRPGARRRKPEDMVRELANKIPYWCAHLESTGAGLATPMSAGELAEIVRVAYDPAAARVLDEAVYQGDDVSLDFENIGPAAAETLWDEYRHDSGVSVCWTMSEAPRGTVYSNVLSRLLASHAAVDRKRVSLVFRPVDSARTADVVEKDQNTARTRLTSTRHGSARLAADLDAANATAAEEAKGAGLTYFSMIVSATVEDPERLPEAVAAVEQELAPAARIMLRRAYGGHDAAFAATLPLGVMLNRHVLLPEAIKSAL